MRAATKTHTSPPRMARHQRRLTPTFHRLSTLALAVARNTPRLPRRPCCSSAQKPARKPPKKKRCVGKKVRGNHVWKKHTDDQAVARAPVRHPAERRALDTRLRTVDSGKWYSAESRGSSRAE